jgi:hypothetical protein
VSDPVKVGPWEIESPYLVRRYGTGAVACVVDESGWLVIGPDEDAITGGTHGRLAVRDLRASQAAAMEALRARVPGLEVSSGQ